MKVTLTTREMAICMMMGALRMWQGAKLDTTIIDKDKASPQGFMAEYAFSKQFNLHLDIIGNLEKDSFDFISREGNTIDVKSTDNLDGNLLVKKPMHDIYVLAIVDGSTVYLIGYATKQMLLDEGKRDLGHGPTYFVNRRDLKTW
jgi:hypothetical protein